MQAIDALGVSQDALALPNGGTMVGYRADAAAVSTSMSARLQREVWVEDYITDPGIGTDNYTAFATAIAEAVARGVSTVRFNGRYRTESTIVIPSGIRLIGDGCHYRYQLPTGNIFEGTWIVYRGDPANPALRYFSVQDCEMRHFGIDCGEVDGSTAVSIGSNNAPSTQALLFERFIVFGATTAVKWGDANASTALEQCDDITFRDFSFHSCKDGFILNAMNVADTSVIERARLYQMKRYCFDIRNGAILRISEIQAGLLDATSRMFKFSGQWSDQMLIQLCQSEGDGGKFLEANGSNDQGAVHLIGCVINQPVECNGILRFTSRGCYINSTIDLNGYVRWTSENDVWDGPKEVAQVTVASGARFRAESMRDADGFNGRWLPVGFQFDNDPTAGGYLNSVSVRAGICGRTFIPSIADFYYAGFYVLPTVDNGYTYKVTAVAGACGAEPVWPTVIGNMVVSGGVTFQCAGVSALIKGTGGIQA